MSHDGRTSEVDGHGPTRPGPGAHTADAAQDAHAADAAHATHAAHPTGPGIVVLDIGGTTGALIVHCPQTSVGQEVEIRRRGRRWTGSHVSIRARITGDHVRAAALFGPLEAGRYQVRWRDRLCASEPVVDVDVRPGQVSEAMLPWCRRDRAAEPAGDPAGVFAAY